MKYTALTIGPIIKSLTLAHRTKELWAASFFFSFLMEEIIKNIVNKESIILPYPEKRDLIANNNIDPEKIKTAGIFPDRLILQSENGMFDDLKDSVNEAIKEAIKQFKINDYFIDIKKYLNTHIVEFEYKERPEKFNEKSKENEDNIIFQANDFLATCELQANYTAMDKSVFLKMLEKIDQSEKYKSIFGKGDHFPSIIEIATRGLEFEKDFLKNNFKEEDDIIWNKIVDKGKEEKENNGINQIKDKKLKEEAIKKCKFYGKLKTSHKYIAIVQADGDNIRKIITDVAKSENKSDIFAFQKALSKFSLQATEKIVEYDGTPVYVGGDDLLFFAPVANSEKHIFKLIKEIDHIFKTTVTSKYKDVKPKPSMSYGVSISYYKYPMHEALRSAQKLLFDKAKNTANKNAIAFKVLKHSGQIFEAVLSKPLQPEFISMLDEDNGLAINSVIYNLEKHKTILKEVIGDKPKLHNFFTNFYNEEEHKKVEGFICKVEELLYKTNEKITEQDTMERNEKTANNEYIKPESDTERTDRLFKKTKNQVYAQLRLIKFLNRKNDE